MSRINNFPSFLENPSSVVKLKGVSVGGAKLDDPSVVVDEGGEVVARIQKLANGAKKIYDNKHFVKVFNDSFDDLAKLSNSGMRVLVYIWKNVKRDKDEIYIDAKVCAEECGYTTKVSVYDGIADLLANDFIFRGVGGNGRYFINVEKFFNGDRTKLDPLKELQKQLDSIKR